MSKLEEQKALPRRKLFRLLDDLEKGVIYARDIDGNRQDRPKVRKAKKAKGKR